MVEISDSLRHIRSVSVRVYVGRHQIIGSINGTSMFFRSTQIHIEAPHRSNTQRLLQCTSVHVGDPHNPGAPDKPSP